MYDGYNTDSEEYDMHLSQSVSTRTEHYVNVSLGESSERIKPDYKQGVFRPTLVQMSWQWVHDAQGWRLADVTMSGPMIKKDGGDSENRGKRRFTPYGFGNWELVADTPEWIRTLVDMHTPTVVGR